MAHGGQVLMQTPDGFKYYAYQQVPPVDVAGKAVLKALKDAGVGQAGSAPSSISETGSGTDTGDSMDDESGGDFGGDYGGDYGGDSSGGDYGDYTDDSSGDYTDGDGNTYDQNGNMVSSGGAGQASSSGLSIPSGKMGGGGSSSGGGSSGNARPNPRGTTASPTYNFIIGPGPQVPNSNDVLGTSLYNYSGARGVPVGGSYSTSPGAGGYPNATTVAGLNASNISPMLIVLGFGLVALLVLKK